jgi:hypothetical protein
MMMMEIKSKEWNYNGDGIMEIKSKKQNYNGNRNRE